MASRRSWWTAPYWIVVGALAGFGVLSVLTIGAFVLAVAAALLVMGTLIPVLRTGAWPLAFAGCAAGPWYVAWLNRGGPGNVCMTSAGEVRCAEEWSPWPFAVAGLLAVVLGVTVFTYVRSRRHEDAPGCALALGTSRPRE
jgi:hypothetical protein